MVSESIVKGACMWDLYIRHLNFRISSHCRSKDCGKKERAQLAFALCTPPS